MTWPKGAKKPKTAQLHNLAGKFNDYGIDDNFIKQTQDQVTEGASALFLIRYQFESPLPSRTASIGMCWSNEANLPPLNG